MILKNSRCRLLGKHQMKYNRILLLTLEYPPDVGGIARYARSTADLFSSANVTVLADGSYSVNETLNNTPVIRSQFFFKNIWPRWLRAFPIFVRTVFSRKIDLIIVFQALPLGTMCYILSKFTGVPYIVSLHGYDVLKGQESKRKKIILKAVLRSAKGIIVNSEFTKKLVKELINTPKPVFVFYPVPSQGLKEEHSSPRIPDSITKPVILSVGRLVKRKGFDLVIRVLPKVIREFPSCTYVIVGSGPMLETLKQVSYELNIQDHILFINGASDSELLSFYSIADLFVMPSYSIGSDVEGFGLVFLEAALFNLPTVGAKTGGIPEAIVDGVTGILIREESEKELLDAIMRILKNPSEGKKMGTLGRERVLKRFILEKQRPNFLSWLEVL